MKFVVPGIENIPAALQYSLLARLALLTQASTTAALAVFSPTSLTARILQTGGAIGELLAWLLLVVTALGWVDFLLNDLLRGRLARWVARFLVANQHTGYLTLGALFLVQAFAGSSLGPAGGSVLVVNYVAIGTLCSWFGLVVALRGSYRDGR